MFWNKQNGRCKDCGRYFGQIGTKIAKLTIDLVEEMKKINNGGMELQQMKYENSLQRAMIRIYIREAVSSC